MLEIFLYGIGVMYSPGPVNIMGFNEGLKGKFFESMWFFGGVGAAMLILCIALGFLGEYIVKESALPYLATIGCAYIVYLAYKIYRSTSELDISADRQDIDASKTTLGFSNGLLIQLLNPKAMLALVPITTIMFPAPGVIGSQILWYAAAIGLLAMWAPGSYSYIGALINKRGPSRNFLKAFNYFMVLLLLGSAAILFYENVLQVFLQKI